MGKGFKVTEPSANIVKWYSSPEEFHEYCSNPKVRTAHSSGGHTLPTSDWGGANYDGALKSLLQGDADRAVLAAKLFDEVVIAQTETLGRSVIAPSIVGHTPNVPAVIAGMPETMLTRQVTQQLASNAPIRVVVDLFASWQITQQEFIKRGVAALAFTMVMNTIRPIDLYVAHTGGSMHIPNSAVAHIIKVDTKPLDLPRAVWMMSDPSFFRRLGFCSIMHELRPLQEERMKRINYPPDSIPAPIDDRGWLGLTQNDIYIEKLVHRDILAITDPMAWVNSMILQHMYKDEVNKLAEETT